MGRLFSTIYRFVLVGVSVSALVFSVMSGTSCAFVKFDHQYKSEGRHLGNSYVYNNNAAAGKYGGDSKRALQSASIRELAPVEDPTAPSLGDTIDPDANFTSGLTEMSANFTADPTADALAVSTAEDNAMETTKVPEDIATPIAAPESVGTLSPQPSIDVSASGQVADQGQISDAMGPLDPEDNEPGDTTLENGLDYEPEEYNPTPTDWSDEGSAASESSPMGDGASQAAATAAGDAGLYCDGAQFFSVTNLWGQSAQELKDELVAMSDQNQSEELARAAVVAASMFGLVAAFILIMESLIGWTMCCERWIVGLLAACASVSQGVTFLFFNSERYCGGDIVHEILNQEPCVLGQGAVFSVIAIILYALAMVMACRLPQDDPYGPCCKARSAVRNSDGARGGDVGGNKFGLLGKSASDAGTPDTADSDAVSSERKGERPNWLSEEKQTEREENEII